MQEGHDGKVGQILGLALSSGLALQLGAVEQGFSSRGDTVLSL